MFHTDRPLTVQRLNWFKSEIGWISNLTSTFKDKLPNLMVWAVKEVSSLMSFFLPGGLWVLPRSNCQRFLKFLSSWCHNPSEKEVTSFACHVPIIVEFKVLKNLLWQSPRKRSSFCTCNCLSSFSSSLTSSRLSPARNLQADLQKVPKLTENVWSLYKEFPRQHQFTLNRETLQAILECHIFPSVSVSLTHHDLHPHLPVERILLVAWGWKTWQDGSAGHRGYWEFCPHSLLCIFSFVLMKYHARICINKSKVQGGFFNLLNYQRGSWQYSCLDVSWRLTDKDVWYNNNNDNK